MKIKKMPFIFAIAASTLIVVGSNAFAAPSDNGMMNMMGNGNMDRMMEAMNSPEGQKMMDACGDFMESYDDKEAAGSEV